MVAGDFNQWDLGMAMEEFTDMRESKAGQTRGNRTIDRCFSNLESIDEVGTLQPLETEDNVATKQSDHRVCYITAKLKRKPKYKWLKYSYRYNNNASAVKFGEWLACKDWSYMDGLQGSDKKAEAYQADIGWAIENFFPLRVVKRRDIDPPWINGQVKKLVRTRKRVFKDTEGRTTGWRVWKDRTEALIEKRKRVYHESQKKALLAPDADDNFYKNTKNYMSHERPRPFDVMDMYPGQEEQQVAEKLPAHFNEISNEFVPLSRGDCPITFDHDMPILEPYQVAGRLRAFKKPKSMVRGDIFLDLVTNYADLLVIPLTYIYNDITRTKTWPRIWKEEFVTIIPKTTTPTEIGQLRNISCTMLASKVESYILEWAAKWAKLKSNQYGGPKAVGQATWLYLSGRKSWKT